MGAFVAMGTIFAYLYRRTNQQKKSLVHRAESADARHFHMKSEQKQLKGEVAVLQVSPNIAENDTELLVVCSLLTPRLVAAFAEENQGLQRQGEEAHREAGRRVQAGVRAEQREQRHRQVIAGQLGGYNGWSFGQGASETANISKRLPFLFDQRV